MKVYFAYLFEVILRMFTVEKKTKIYYVPINIPLVVTEQEIEEISNKLKKQGISFDLQKGGGH